MDSRGIEEDGKGRGLLRGKGAGIRYKVKRFRPLHPDPQYSHNPSYHSPFPCPYLSSTS